MDSSFACCAGGMGLTPAFGIVGSSSSIQMIFSLSGLRWLVKNGTSHDNWGGLAFLECRERKEV